MICISPMEYHWNEWYSIGTNRTNRANGQVECTPSQPETVENILSARNDTHFTNGIPLEWMIFHWYQSYQSYQWTSRMHPSQPETVENILSARNDMHFTNGIPMAWGLFHWYQSYQWTSGMHPLAAWSPRNILSPCNYMAFTNGIPLEWMIFHWSLFVSIGQPLFLKRASSNTRWIQCISFVLKACEPKHSLNMMYILRS